MSANQRGHVELPTAWIPLPCGTRLAARIWLPEGCEDAPVPAVLEYLPYRRRDQTAPRDESTYPAFAAAGIAGVRVDLRGSGDSEGVFDDEYSETELSDAEAVIAWIASQPWCSGNVGMMGISWGGFNALQVAARRPPALKAVISIASTVDRFADDIHYKGGCQLSANLYWSTTMLAKIARPPDANVLPGDWEARWLDRLEQAEPLIFTWASHQRRDAYWRHGSICDDFGALDCPAFVIAGWADAYRNVPTEALAGLGGATSALTGPWIHKYPHFAWPRPRVDFVGEAIGWWDRWLKGDTGARHAPAGHRLFLSEGVRPSSRRLHDAGRWVRIDGPGPENVLHLGSAGTLGAPCEDAVLPIRTPFDCGAHGGEYFTVNNGPDLPGDQRPDDGMSVCFETRPLEGPVDVIGRPVLRLPVTIDAAVGTLVARLVDVHPDGTAHRVSMGVLNLTHRHGSEEPQPMTPGVEEVIEIRLDATGYRFPAGHRLRLALSTAYFPLLLPPPTDVTAMVRTGAVATLTLPSAVYTEIALPEPADNSPLPAYADAPEARVERSIRHDRSTERTTVSIEDDSGDATHPDHGVTWRDRRRSVWSVNRFDPLSAHGKELIETERRYGTHETRVVAGGDLRVTQSHWLIESTLEAFIGKRLVISKKWSREIERDLI